MTDPEHPDTLPRPQRRLLARLFHGRSEPVVVDGRAFLTFQEAKRYLLALDADCRETAYQAMKKQG